MEFTPTPLSDAVALLRLDDVRSVRNAARGLLLAALSSRCPDEASVDEIAEELRLVKTGLHLKTHYFSGMMDRIVDRLVDAAKGYADIRERAEPNRVNMLKAY